MRSYQLTDFGASLALAESQAPVPTGSEVLVRISACGVCHSDIHLWDGYFDLGDGKKIHAPPAAALPLTLGHEIVGEVVALGPSAEGAALGERRVVYPWIGCGECAVCTADKEYLCARPRALGINRHGGYSDHVLVPHPRYLLEFDGLDEDMACTYACSGLTSYSALKKVGLLTDKDPLLIIGAGGVGLAGVRLAKEVCGVAPIVADIDEAKLSAARAAGAADVLNSAADGAAKELLARTGGGVAAAIDFVGSESSAAFGDRVLRKGGKLVIVGLFGGRLTLPIPLIPMRAITICGSYVGSLGELRELLLLARRVQLPALPLATRPLDRATETLADLRAGRVTGRVVLKP